MSATDGWWVEETDRLDCPNKSARTRKVEMVVIHTTVCPQTSQTNRERITRWITAKGNASTHMTILRDGTVLQGVPTTECAWHAGSSAWTTASGRKITGSVNQYSIGIDIDNIGRLTKRSDGLYDCYGKRWGGESICVGGVYVEPFTAAQIKSLIEILSYVVPAYGIDRYDVVGHADVSPGRKVDPDVGMPWALIHAMLDAGVDEDTTGGWYAIIDECAKLVH